MVALNCRVAVKWNFNPAAVIGMFDSDTDMSTSPELATSVVTGDEHVNVVAVDGHMKLASEPDEPTICTWTYQRFVPLGLATCAVKI